MSPSHPATAVPRRDLMRALSWALPLFGAFIVAVMWAGVYLLLRFDLERTENEAYRKVEQATQAYEAHVERLLQQVDQLTAVVALNAQTSGERIDLPRLVRDTFANQLSLGSLYLADEAGNVVAAATTGGATPNFGSVAERPYFTAHLSGPHEALFVGVPTLGQPGGQWEVHVSRARRHPDGRFAGVVVATLYPAFLTEFYSEAQYGRQGVVGLIGQDGVVRSRRMGDQLTFGQRVERSRLAELATRLPQSSYLGHSEVDGVPRYLAYRVLPTSRLVAYTGLSQAEVLQAYFTRRDALLRFFGVATVAVVAAFTGFSVLLRRLQRSRRQTEEAVARFEAASNAQLDAFFILSAQRAGNGSLLDFRVDHANPRAALWMERPLDRLEGRSATALLPESLRLRLFSAYCTVVETQRPLVEEFALERANDRPIGVVQQVVPVGDGVAITMRDVTELRRKEEDLLNSRAALALSEQRLRAITNNLPVLIAYVDQDLVMRFVNETHVRWFGPAWGQAEGQPLSRCWPPELYAQRMPYVMQALGGETVEFVAERDTLSGQRLLQNSYIPDRDDSGRVVGLYMMGTDVTELKRTEAELFELLHTDTLTGLDNRRSFNERLPQAVARARRTGKGLALLYVDVDRFKAINDTHGHAVGDGVLQVVAQRLRQSVRLADTVARLSGDEFVVVLEDLSSPLETEFVARKLVRQFAVPVEVEGLLLDVTTSVGVAYDEAGTLDGPALLARADAALYEAKSGGRNAFAVAG